VHVVAVGTSSTSDGVTPPSPLRAAFVAIRPRQWLKNVLVLAAPVAAGALFQREVLLTSGLAFVAFCLASSAAYLLNDTVDRDIDRLHPAKQYRPIASRAMAPSTALVLAAVLAGAAVGVAALTSVGLVVSVAVYLILASSYSLGLKHQAVLDLCVVTALFVVRAVAGGAAASLPISAWFLIVAAFGSLFLVAGKRYSELLELGGAAPITRPSLAHYSASYLRFVWSVAAAVTVTAYCLWAFDVGDGNSSVAWAEVSVAPFVIALLRYARDIDSGRAGAPDEIALNDRVLQLLVLLWAAAFALEAFGV
jgi:decaprenyl-phosphate phosphoribosyltransferase